MKSLLLAALLLASTARAADQWTFIANETLYTLIDDEAGTTNNLAVWTFRAPQPLGQFQDAITMGASDSPTSVSNAIVARTTRMLSWIGRSNDTINVVMP